MLFRSPRGLFCDTLGARLHIVDAGATALRSLEACMARCDLEIEELVSAPMAAGLACLVDDERALGATVIDMGGGTTGIAVFAENQLMHTAQLPIGGLHVTKDLAMGLSTTQAHAERFGELADRGGAGGEPFEDLPADRVRQGVEDGVGGGGEDHGGVGGTRTVAPFYT